MQNEYGQQASENVRKFLHPYDRASETLFSVSVLSFLFPLPLISLSLCVWIVFCFVPELFFNKLLAKQDSVKYLYKWPMGINYNYLSSFFSYLYQKNSLATTNI